jgi:hypothetical protein
MEPPSSTSSSDRSLASWPRVPAAGWAALAVALLGGLALRTVASPGPGVPPLDAFSGLDSESYRCAAASAGARGSEILLLGSSLMRYGVREDQLAADLGEPDLLVLNAALDGGRLWDVLRLVDSLPPIRAPKRRLAVLEVNRVAAESAVLPHPYEDARLRGQGLPVRPPGLRSLAEAIWEQVPPRQDAITWAQQAVYGTLARRVPSLVPVPHAIPRVLWMLTEAQRERAARGKEPASMGTGMLPQMRQTPEVLKLLVTALHQRGLRVLLLQTPLHGEMLEALARLPFGSDLERTYRADVLDPAMTGADAVLAFDRTGDIGGDDTMLADYGHLLPAGSELLTRRLARYLERAPIWEDGVR